MRKKLVALALVSTACRSEQKVPPSEQKGPGITVPLVTAADASIEGVPAAVSPCANPPPPVAIENGRCKTNADCVLTDLPQQCNACNVERLYPTLRSGVDERSARCVAGCVPRGCPPRDTYTGAFFRAECREGRCIAFRYHAGG